LKTERRGTLDGGEPSKGPEEGKRCIYPPGEPDISTTSKTKKKKRRLRKGIKIRALGRTEIRGLAEKSEIEKEDRTCPAKPRDKRKKFSPENTR